MSKSVIDSVSDYIGWDTKTTKEISKSAPRSYKRYEIPKKKGGRRTIYHPSKNTKALQYAIIDIILSNIKVHNSAFAYKPNLKSPLLKNAQKHSKYAYSIRVDFENYFPSIVPEDLMPIIEKKFLKRNLNTEEEQFLKNSLFIKYKNYGFSLGIGSPSSPMISNIVMYEIDENLCNYSSQNSAIYTRYSDDIVYSTNKKGECAEFIKYLKYLLKETESPVLKINNEKTFYMSRKNRRVVTGLFITPDGKVSIGRNQKRYIRKLVFDFKNGNLDDESIIYLKGYLNYILDVESTFYNSLANKYGKEVIKIMKQY